MLAVDPSGKLRVTVDARGLLTGLMIVVVPPRSLHSKASAPTQPPHSNHRVSA